LTFSEPCPLVFRFSSPAVD